MLSKTLIFFLWSLFITPINSEHHNKQNTEPKLVENIAYGTIDGVTLALNIAIPNGGLKTNKHSLIIFIHGGGWKEGHRSAYNNEIIKAAKRGYVAASISHRLTAIMDKDGNPLYPWPAAIHDCKAAVRFLKSNADTYNIDVSKIGMTGGSSGGHLALMVGLTNNSNQLEGNIKIIGAHKTSVAIDSKIHAVVNISGPTDMVSCYEAPIVTPYLNLFMGGSPKDNPKAYFESSPINYISNSAIPVMTIHGELDDVVPVSQAIILDNKFKALGLKHELNIFKGQKHIFKGSAVQKSWDVFYTFFDKHLKKE